MIIKLNQTKSVLFRLKSMMNDSQDNLAKSNLIIILTKPKYICYFK